MLGSLPPAAPFAQKSSRRRLLCEARHPTLLRRLAAITTVAAASLATPHAAGAVAAKHPSCLRGGATLERADGPVRVVRRTLRRWSPQETRGEALYACWARTGKRTKVV